MAQHDRTLIETLAGVQSGSPIDRALQARSTLLHEIELGYRAALEPPLPGSFTLAERRIVAAFVAVLQDEAQTRAHFLGLIRGLGAGDGLGDLAVLIETEAEGAAWPGPYGSFPPGPLSVEDLDGPAYLASPALAARLGQRLAAALEHAHLLVLHPRDAGLAALDRLTAAGWSDAEIHALTELVGFVEVTIRAVAGLRAYSYSRQPHAADARHACAFEYIDYQRHDTRG